MHSSKRREGVRAEREGYVIDIYIYQLDGNVLSFLLTEVKTKTIVKIVND